MPIPAVRLNHAVLFVADVERSIAFYRDAFGAEIIAHEPRMRAAFLRMPRSTNHHDLGLFGVGAQPARERGSIGLYHLAWQVDTIEDLDEADQLADQICVIDHGRIIAQGTPLELKNQSGATSLVVTVSRHDEVSRAAELVRGAVGEVHVDADARRLTAPGAGVADLTRIVGAGHVLTAERRTRAFTKGFRYGGGPVAAVVYDWEVVDAVPHDAFDQAVDAVITPQGFFRI